MTRKKRVGVMDGSSADRYVTEKYGAVCHVLRYPGSTEALRLVEDGQLDATVQDLPVLHFYDAGPKSFLLRGASCQLLFHAVLLVIFRPQPCHTGIAARPLNGESTWRANR